MIEKFQKVDRRNQNLFPESKIMKNQKASVYKLISCICSQSAVFSDTLAAFKLQNLYRCVKACIRSFDKIMPNKTNRITADHTSGYL